MIKKRPRSWGTLIDWLSFRVGRTRNQPGKSSSPGPELNKEALFHKVQDNDLFVMKARYHPLGRNFNTEYENLVRGKDMLPREDSSDSLQGRKIATHQRSFEKMKLYDLGSVTEHNEDVQVTLLHKVHIAMLESQLRFPNADNRTEYLISSSQGEEDISHSLAFSKIHSVVALSSIPYTAR